MFKSETGLFFSFYTPDSDDSSEWGVTGDNLRLALANTLKDADYQIDLSTPPLEPDWVFYAEHGDERFSVVLVLANSPPSGWWIGVLEPIRGRDAPQVVRDAVFPLLVAAVERFPSTYGLRWHTDWKTISEI